VIPLYDTIPRCSISTAKYVLYIPLTKLLFQSVTPKAWSVVWQ